MHVTPRREERTERERTSDRERELVELERLETVREKLGLALQLERIRGKNETNQTRG